MKTVGGQKQTTKSHKNTAAVHVEATEGHKKATGGHKESIKRRKSSREYQFVRVGALAYETNELCNNMRNTRCPWRC